jgi:hypothetical protein
MSISTSIYIPRMSVDHTDQFVRHIMEFYGIGIVSHIDFTPINKKPGFGENVDQVVKSAFVHFSDPWFCSDKVYRFQDKTYSGNYKCWQTIASGQQYKLHVSQTEYWLFLKNKNPIQRTMMNIHQVVENGRHLESLIEAQEKTIQEQSKKIEYLERKLAGTQSVIYQLIGGLFHQRDQNEIMSYHLDDLFCQEDNKILNHGNISKWGI